MAWYMGAINDDGRVMAIFEISYLGSFGIYLFRKNNTQMLKTMEKGLKVPRWGKIPPNAPKFIGPIPFLKLKSF